MLGFNQVILAGNVVAKPELRYVAEYEIEVCDLRIAVSERLGKNKEKTLFVDVTLWGSTARIAREYLTKGREVLIVGRLRKSQWTVDDQVRSRLKVVGDKMLLMGPPPSVNKKADEVVPESSEPTAPSVSSQEPDDDVPF